MESISIIYKIPYISLEDCHLGFRWIGNSIKTNLFIITEVFLLAWKAKRKVAEI